jgi:DNA-binding transcriptional regulator YbjK
MAAANLVRAYSVYKYERTCTLLSVTRAEASQRVRDAIVAATVRIVAAEGVGAVTHRRVASEASVSLSSTTWHYAAKPDILRAALEWCARREVDRIEAIASRLVAFDLAAWTNELADWLIEQVTVDRESTVALYRLQAELLGSPGALELHREWGDGLRAVGSQAADLSDIDVRLVIAALDGLRFAAMNADELSWVRPAVERQLSALLG